MKRKKSQAENQVFVFLLTAIIIGLLFIFGVKAIGYIIDLQHKAEEVQFKVDLEDTFTRIRPNHMSSENMTFITPEKIRKVCFVDQELINDRKIDKSTTGLCNKNVNDGIDYDPIMCETWDGSTAENVFCKEPLNIPIYVGRVKIDNSGYKCFNVISGKFEVVLIGLGDGVKIN